MSTETHINQFVRDVEEKYDAAVKALGEFKNAMEALKGKAVAMSPEIRDAIGVGENAVNEVEQKAEETNTAADEESNAGAKASGGKS